MLFILYVHCSEHTTPAHAPDPSLPGRAKPSLMQWLSGAEYLHSHRSLTFEPVAPRGNMTPAQTPNWHGAAVPVPAPMPIFNAPDTQHRSLWIVAQVKGTGHQMYQVRDTVVTYWVNRWEPPAIGDDPPSLPPSGDLENLDHVTAARAILKYKINIFSCYHPMTCILAPTIHV